MSAEFAKRYTARKKLFLDSQPDNKRLDARLFELAIEPGAARTIVFIEAPEKALEMKRRIEKLFPGRVELLTGTMRGQERDLLTAPENAVFMAFVRNEAPSDRVFPVSTSAGEVGINITSERVVTEIQTVDHLMQRFGRLNRFGEGVGEAHVVYSPAKLQESAPMRETLQYLEQIAPEFSSQVLREKPPRREAKSEDTKTAYLHEWLIDLWCQTSDPVKANPKVEPWLHGKQEREIADTEIAWREDVRYLTSTVVGDADRQRALRVFPVLARERLREPTSRVKEKLKQIAEHCDPETRILIRERDGSVCAETLSALAERRIMDLAYTLIVLPLGCGGLDSGMLSPAETAETATDLADVRTLGKKNRRRYLRYADGNPTPLVSGDDLPVLDDGRVRLEIRLTDGEEPPEFDGPRTLLYMQERPESQGSVEYLLNDHLKHVEERARRLADKLLPEMAEVFAAAGSFHDEGKNRKLWQHYMGRCPGKVVAKSFRSPFPNGMGGYRHELGSLARLETLGDLSSHLIAAHHGWGRPYFPGKATGPVDTARSEQIIAETPARFARLTEEYGPWGLAYLEALLKAADAWASADFEPSKKNEGAGDD